MMTRTKNRLMESDALVREIRRMIEEARSTVAMTVNSGMTMLYWQIGRRMQQEILQGKRAEYGEQIVSTVSRQLEIEYGPGFSAKNLRHTIRFAEVFGEFREIQGT